MRRRAVIAAIAWAAVAGAAEPVTYHRDVEPILRRHCQNCHRAGEIGPMPLVNYRQVRPWAKAIREAVALRKMPPWFADRAHGRFANDPSLTERQIAVLRAWAEQGAPEGDSKDAAPAAEWPDGWTAAAPDAVIEAPRPFTVPARGSVDYQYFVIALPWKEDRWVQMAEIRPSERAVVHHVVAYIREADSEWLRDAPRGVAWAPSGDTASKRRAAHTTSDILAVYAPGSDPVRLPAGMAKRIPAGSDLILQVHYTPNGKRPVQDRPRIGLVFAAEPPTRQVLTLQMGNDRIRIPPGERDYRLSVSGTLPNDALLLSFFPHMHLRGRSFEYRIVAAGGRYETLLRVAPYDFYWQMSYVLAEPRLLKAGTRLQMEAHYDNSPNNPRNPDATAEVTWGEQSWEEMMIGFFDVAVDASVDKRRFFVR